MGFEPTPGSEVVESLGVEFVPVRGGADEPPGVDVVEVVGRKSPLEVEVVDLEGQVGRDPGWLHG